MAAHDASRDRLTLEMLDVYGADCPVPPAVWRRFTTENEDIDLILELRDTASAPIVARNLLNLMRDRQPDMMIVSSFLVVSVTISELVAGVLALTSWQRLMVKVGTLSRGALEDELADLTAERTLRARDGWEMQDLGRLRWLLAQLKRTLGRRATPARLKTLFDVGARFASQSEDSPIRTVGLNRDVRPAVLESRVTVKADAAERVFQVDAARITWAVVDSGIDRSNIAFLDPSGTQAGAGAPPPSRIIRSFDVPRAVNAMRQEDPTTFVGLASDSTWLTFSRLAGTEVTPSTPSTDPLVRHHGTHVAGILAGDERPQPPAGRPPLVGVCPTLRIVDLRVFDDRGRCEELWVIVALRFIRWMNDRSHLAEARRIDGVNLSISTPYEVDAQACGWTPVCAEAEQLVDAGVVVVAAAGNQAFDTSGGTLSLGTGFRFLSITDPGNAEAVITVGATDRRMPHRFGPIASSGRGPTADGRHKPDLLAPGNLITSATFQAEPQQMTGTSQAAPHVSGVAAMLMGRYPELRGKPRDVKAILCDTASDLGRLQDFQGAGIVDALRAMQRR
jgi:hypothetical protein